MRRALPAAIVLSAFILYAFTLAPGLLWGDSAKFQRMAWQLDLRFDETGHPLWVMLAHPATRIPGIDPAKACNLLSAALSALALWPAFRVMRRLGAPEAASTIACLSLAVSHTYWFHAVVTEVYALNSLITLALLEVVTSDRRRSAVFWLVIGVGFGLASGNHLQVMLWLPGLAVWVASGCRAGRVKPAWAALAAAGMLAALAPFMVLGEGLPRTQTLPALVWKLVRQMVWPDAPARDALQWAGYLLYQFPVPLMLAAAGAGVWVLWRGRRVDLAGLLVLFACNLGFAFSYQVPDRFAFFLPSYLILALLAAPGLEALLGHGAPRRRLAAAAILCVAAPPVIYGLAPSLIGPRVPDLFPSARTLPGRDAVRFHLDPSKRGVDGALRFSRAALDLMPAGALLIADYTPREPLDYAQVVYGVRPDVEVTYVLPKNQLRVALERTSRSQPVFLASKDTPYDVAGLSTRFDIRPSGPVFALVPRLHPQSED